MPATFVMRQLRPTRSPGFLVYSENGRLDAPTNRPCDGSTIPAVELQRVYLDAAKKRLAGKDAQTDWVLREWEYVLAGLELDPMVLADRLDWVAKRKMLMMFMEADDVGWHDDVLQSLDMEYHNINPCTGLYYGLVEGAWRHWCRVWEVDYEWMNGRFSTHPGPDGKPIRMMNTPGIPSTRWFDATLLPKEQVTQPDNIKAMELLMRAMAWHLANAEADG